MSNKVKRPMNAYMFFSKEKRAEIIQQNPELKSKVAEIAKLIGNHWKEMTSEEKIKYQNLALEDKKEMKVKFKNKDFNIMTEKQKHKEEWKIQLEKEKKIAKEFKIIKNKWVKNWEFLVWEDKQIGLSTCLDEELNDTYKLRSSYENKNHFCDE